MIQLLRIEKIIIIEAPDLPPPHTHIHYRKQKKRKNSTLECKELLSTIILKAKTKICICLCEEIGGSPQPADLNYTYMNEIFMKI